MKYNIEQLEDVVNNNTKLFYWDGWDLIHIIEDELGYMKKNGIFKDDKWYVKQVFKCEDGYWDIPNRIAGMLNV